MKKVMYLCNDKIFETADEAMIDCTERGILGSSCKDHIEELPYIGRTYEAGKAEGAREKAMEILENASYAKFIDSWGLEAIYMKDLKQLCQPQETEGKIPLSPLSDEEKEPIPE